MWQLALFSGAFAELVGIVALSRHGTRAANKNILEICPNYAQNFKWYLQTMQVAPGGLTPKGMYDIYRLGQYVRDAYVNTGFLPPVWRTADSYTQAVGVDRTIQSGVLYTQGLYPAGSAPSVFPVHSIPAPVPVYVVPVEDDDLLESRVASCEDQILYDTRLWDGTIGIKHIQDHIDVINEVGHICGIDLLAKFPLTNFSQHTYNLADALKDITDAFMFDFDQGNHPLNGIYIRPLPGLTIENFAKFRALASTMLYGRLYSTEQKVNYMAGGFPKALLRHFESAKKGAGKIWAYHGHREILYAMGKFLGITFDIGWPGLPKGAIPAATTLFWELHKHGENYTVHTYFWIPSYQLDGALPTTYPIILDACGGKKHCPLDEFHAFIDERLKQYGTIEDLCTKGQANTTHPHDPSKFFPDIIPDDGTANFGKGIIAEQNLFVVSGDALWVGRLVFLLLAVALLTPGVMLIWKHRQERNQYIPL